MNEARIELRSRATDPTHSTFWCIGSSRLQPVYTMADRMKKAARIQKRIAFALMGLLHLLAVEVDRGGVWSILRRSDADRDAGLRVVQVERRGLATDTRDRGEVVSRRRAARRPLERPAVTPRIVHRDLGCVASRQVHID